MPDWNWSRAVRLDDEQAVEADRAARVRADRDADAAALGAAGALAAQRRLLRLPLEELAPLSSASLTKALVTYACLPLRQRRAERRVAGTAR